MPIAYEASDWRTYKMNWHDPHREIESMERELGVVEEALAALVHAGILPHASYPLAKMLAHRDAVRQRFEIPWTAISPRMQRLMYAINAIAQPKVMVAVGIFCGNTFVSNAGAAIGPGAHYQAERLIGLEVRPEHADQARRNVATIEGNDGVAEILGEDGNAWLRGFDGIVDLLYLDADGPRGSAKSIYYDLLQSALHVLRPGSLMLAHNSVNAAGSMADYLAYVRDPGRFRQSANMIVDDQGLEVSIL